MTIEKYFNKYLSILFCIIPILLVTGPALPDISISIIAIYFLFISLKKKFFIKLNNQSFFTKIFIIFWLYILFRSVFSSDPFLSLGSSLFYLRFLFFVLGVLYLMEESDFIIKNYHKFLFCTFLILCIDGYIQLFRGENLFGYKLVWGRVSSFFGPELKMGNFVARLMPILVGLYILNLKKKINILYLFFLFIFVDILVFISGERLAFALLTLQTIIFILCYKSFRILRIFSLIFSAGIIALILNFNDHVYERMITHTSDQLSINTENNFIKTNIFSYHHQKIYENAFRIFLNNPIFGIGTKLFRVKCFDYSSDPSFECSSHPHNIYIQFLAELGIIGFLFLISGLIYISYRLIKIFIRSNFTKNDLHQSEITLFALIGVFINLFPFAPSFNFFNNWFSIIFFIPIIFLKYGDKKK